MVRREGDTDTAVTGHTDSLSGDLTIVVSLKSPGTTVRVPVRVCKLSTRVIEIPPKPLLCSFSSVKVVDSWTPDSSQKKAESTTTSSLEDMSVKIDTSNLTPDQISRAREFLGDWSGIFSTSRTDLGRAVVYRVGVLDHFLMAAPSLPQRAPSSVWFYNHFSLSLSLWPGDSGPLSDGGWNSSKKRRV